MTAEEALKKEIIQLLCVEQMSHSGLNKQLAEDVNRETGMEKVIESVATFRRRPSAKGIYELKKEFYDQYNVFFYHYSREEQSKVRFATMLLNVYRTVWKYFRFALQSEEAQRARRKAEGLPECTPPPPLPRFTPQFEGVSRIMDSDVFMYFLSVVLQRADNLKTRCFSEGQVHRALHLIGICLNEEETQAKLAESAASEEERARLQPAIRFTERAKKFNILGHLEKLVGNQRINSHKELLTWILNKWKSPSAEEAAAASASSSSVSPEEVEAAKAKEKKAAAAARRAKLMAQMKSAQNKFIKTNAADMANDTEAERQRKESTCSNPGAAADVKMPGEDDKPAVALGPERSPPTPSETLFTCILCQEEQGLSAEGPSLVMSAFVQKSKVLSKRRNCVRDVCGSANREASSSSLEDMDVAGSGEASAAASPSSSSSSHSTSLRQYESCPVLLADMPSAPHTSSCGHIMHSSCWQKFYDDIMAHDRQRNRGVTRHPHSFDVERQEFLCPLCRRLSNAVIPLIPQFHLLQPPQSESSPPSSSVGGGGGEGAEFSDWCQGLKIALKYKRELKSESEDERLKVSDQNDAPMMSEANEDGGGGGGGAPSAAAEDSDEQAGPLSSSSSSNMVLRRYYTCPLEQVAQELLELTSEERAQQFTRLYTVHEGSELQFSESTFDMMNLFSQTVFRSSTGSAPEVLDERLPLLVWQTCAYTVHSVVWSVLGRGSSVFGEMSSRHRDCLSGLVRFCGVVGSNFGKPRVIRSHALKLLSTLLEVDTANLSVLEFDAFGMLVALTFSLPSLFNDTQAAPLPACNSQDKNILQLLYLAHLVQILLTTDQFSTEEKKAELAEDEEAMEHQQSETKDKDEKEYLPILELLQLVRGAVGFASESDGLEGLSARCVWGDACRASLPFLRCCAVFYRHLSGVPLPDQGGDFLPFLDADGEFSRLADYLGLPRTPRDLLSSPQCSSLALRWANHPSVHIALSASPAQPPVTHPSGLLPLVSLPQDYSELITAVSGFVCPKSAAAAASSGGAASSSSSFASVARVGEESRVPALCLVCGRLLCSQSYCCQETLDGETVGACTAHADKCGAGNGVFLRVRECKVILLSGRKKGCSIPPPYLDR